MSELTERARVHLNWARHDLIRELADRVDELEAAEFVGRLPDYIKELETERDEANARIDKLELAVLEMCDCPADMEDIARRCFAFDVYIRKTRPGDNR